MGERSGARPTPAPPRAFIASRRRAGNGSPRRRRVSRRWSARSRPSCRRVIRCSRGFEASSADPRGRAIDGGRRASSNFIATCSSRRTAPRTCHGTAALNARRRMGNTTLMTNARARCGSSAGSTRWSATCARAAIVPPQSRVHGRRAADARARHRREHGDLPAGRHCCAARASRSAPRGALAAVPRNLSHWQYQQLRDRNGVFSGMIGVRPLNSSTLVSDGQSFGPATTEGCPGNYFRCWASSRSSDVR